MAKTIDQMEEIANVDLGVTDTLLIWDAGTGTTKKVSINALDGLIGSGATATTLDSLTDTDLTGLTTGQYISFDGVNWVPAAAPADGATGPAGADGATGPTGPAGADSTVAGPAGNDGATGPAGADGAEGPTGPAGADSTVAGPTGPAGNDGATGPAGPAGDDAPNTLGALTDTSFGLVADGDVVTMDQGQWINSAPATSTEPLGDGATDLFTYSAAAPSVASGAAVYRSNNGNGTVTNFINGVDGQRFTIDIRHDMTIADSSLISLEGSVDHTFALGDTVSFVYQDSATTTGWRETSRTYATAEASSAAPLGDGGTVTLTVASNPDVSGQESTFIGLPTAWTLYGWLNPTDGQRWTYVCGAGTTQIQHHSTMPLLDEATWNMVDGDRISFVYYAAGNRTYETSRTYVNQPAAGGPGHAATEAIPNGTTVADVSSGAAVFTTSFTVDRTLTAFAGATEGQRFTIQFLTNNKVDIADNASIILADGQDFDADQGDTISFVAVSSTVVVETSRTVANIRALGDGPFATFANVNGNYMNVSPGAAVFETTGGATTALGFDGAVDGQRFTVTNRNTTTYTIPNAANIWLQGDVPFEMEQFDSVSFIYVSADNTYRETSRTTVAALSITTPATQAFGNGDATPSVASGSALFLTTGTTTITSFDDVVDGQTFTVYANDSITIQNSLNLFLAGSVNFDMTVGDTCSFVYLGAASRLLETSRMVR